MRGDVDQVAVLRLVAESHEAAGNVELAARARSEAVALEAMNRRRRELLALLNDLVIEAKGLERLENEGRVERRIWTDHVLWCLPARTVRL